MTEEPLVSVLMTAFNRQNYIQVAIESVLASDYEHFELIIVDDCSTDDTLAIARSYARKDQRVKVYKNEHQLGDYPNRNRAASYAQGKYIKYLDSDDYIYPWGLKIMVECMEQFPNAGYGLCSQPQKKFLDQPFPFELTPKEAYRFHYLGPGIFDTPPISAIIKREVFNEVGCFEPGRMVGDLELWHRLSMKHNLVLMMDGIVWIRQHGQGEMKYYRDYLLKYEKVRIDYLTDPRCPLDLSQIRQVFARRDHGMFNLAAYSFLKGQWRRSFMYFNVLFYRRRYLAKKKKLWLLL